MFQALNTLLLLYRAIVLDRAIIITSQMRKLRPRAFGNLYNSKPLVKGRSDILSQGRAYSKT